jgi:hypothetical protein
MANPLICNCNIKWLKDWIKKTNIAAGNPKCTYPQNLSDKSLQTLNDFDLVCKNIRNGQDHLDDECYFNYISENVTSSKDCPKNCSCKNNIIRCSHSNLKMFPLNMPTSIKGL